MVAILGFRLASIMSLHLVVYVVINQPCFTVPNDVLQQESCTPVKVHIKLANKKINSLVQTKKK